MRPSVLILSALAACAVSCSFIPPYSSVREQDLTGKNAIKLFGGVYHGTDVTEEDATYPFSPDVDHELDDGSTLGVEFERQLGQGFTATFSYARRELDVENTAAPIKGDQMAVGLRRYFGGRALTAFAAGQLIYHQGMTFPGELGFDFRETDDFLGLGLGGGINLALSEDFSLEASLIYEIAPDVDSSKELVLGAGAPVDATFNFTGPVAYVGVGFHF